MTNPTHPGAIELPAPDPLAAWALSRTPQASRGPAVDDESLVALATGTLTAAERERIIERLASDPTARELAEALIVEAEAMGLVVATPEDVPSRTTEPRGPSRPWLRAAAALVVAATAGLTYQATRERGGPEARFARYHRLTDLGFEPGAAGRGDAKGGDVDDDLPRAADLKRRLAKVPEDREARLALGFRLLLGNKPGAAEAFRTLLRADPGDREARIGLGLALFSGGPDDVREAVRVFEEALRAEPGSAALRLNLAMCLDRAGRADEAAAQYRAALDAGLEPALVAKVRARIDAGAGGRKNPPPSS